MKRCLICDDHALLRDALGAMVASHWPDCDVVAVGSFTDAWAQAESGFDLCLVDLRMPGAEPMAGIAALREIAPAMRVVVITGTATDHDMLTLVGQGVAGFIEKTVSAAVLEAAMRLVLAGGRYVPERLAEILPPLPAIRLSARQRDVVNLAARGLSNKEIARQLGIAPSSVKTHLTAVQDTLGTANRAESAVRAQQLGLL